MFWKNRQDDRDLAVNVRGLRAMLLRECDGMTRYAIDGGLKPQPSLVALLDQANATTGGSAVATEELVQAHSTLCDLISPAKPCSVIPIVEDEAQHPVLSLFGPGPLVRAFLYIEIVSMLLMLLISLSADVNTKNMELGLFGKQPLGAVEVRSFSGLRFTGGQRLRGPFQNVPLYLKGDLRPEAFLRLLDPTRARRNLGRSALSGPVRRAISIAGVRDSVAAAATAGARARRRFFRLSRSPHTQSGDPRD
jgi:hypothetical protein